MHGNMRREEVAGRRGDIPAIVKARQVSYAAQEATPDPRVRPGPENRADDLPAEEGTDRKSVV